MLSVSLHYFVACFTILIEFQSMRILHLICAVVHMLCEATLKFFADVFTSVYIVWVSGLN